MSLSRKLLLWASGQRWLGDQFRKRAFSRKAVARFMPGETLESALEAARRLGEWQIGSVLTLLGENITQISEADAVAAHYLEMLDAIGRRALDAQPSIKLTQLGLDIDRDRALANLEKIVQSAATHSTVVWIDMEGSAYTDVTIEFYRKTAERHANVGICLQAYLYRTASDLDQLKPLEPRIRLVKGAYMEPPSIAFKAKREVDRNYLELGRSLLDGIREGRLKAVFGTHDQRMITELQRYAADRELPRAALEIHMLYGIRADRQRELAAQGHTVRTLISYGSAWFPWYMRRLAERPANIAFVLRSALGL